MQCIYASMYDPRTCFLNFFYLNIFPFKKQKLRTNIPLKQQFISSDKPFACNAYMHLCTTLVLVLLLPHISEFTLSLSAFSSIMFSVSVAFT